MGHRGDWTTSWQREDELVLLPGPVKIHPRIARAMMRPAMGHRSAEFKEVIRDLTQGLRYLYQTKGPVLLMTGSATLGMEAVVANALQPGEKILVLENGKFGERFSQLARLYAGSGALVVSSPPGEGWNLEQAESVLKQGNVKAVAAVLNESSAGVLNSGEALAKLCKEHNVLFLADGVTAVGGTPVPVDKWGIDACIVGSQKCLGAPSGVTLLSLSERYLEAAKSSSLYLDLKVAAAKWAEEDTPFTPATHLYLAVSEALSLLAEETLEARLERTQRLARSVRAGLAALGVPLFVPDSLASPTVTAARYPTGVVEKEVRSVLRSEFGIALSGGQGSLSGQIFRVGHMGFVQARDLVAFLGCLEAALARTAHGAPKESAMTAFMGAWVSKASV